jgi:hypothetical protein
MVRGGFSPFLCPVRTYRPFAMRMRGTYGSTVGPPRKISRGSTDGAPRGRLAAGTWCRPAALSNDRLDAAVLALALEHLLRE